MPRRQDDSGPGFPPDWRPHDTDRSIDPFDDGTGPPRPPSSRPPVPSPSRPPAPPPSRPAARPGARLARRGVSPRTLLLAGGGLLAVVATVLVFLTDDPDLLRVAVVAAAWAFVLATFVAGRRGSDEAQGAAREDALRRAYEHELELEVAARREYELELENDLRREAEDAMRGELDALRHELAGVTELRDEVARVAGLRDDVAALSGLREEVARVAALREDLRSLSGLRSELGQLGELRAELGRLRSDLTEQFSSEMLVERIIMRTQASRLTADPSARLEAPVAWQEEPARELTGGWPAVRPDEHTGTQQYERVLVDRPAPPHHWQAVARTPEPAAPSYTPPPVPAPPDAREVTAETEGYGLSLPPRRSRHAVHGEEPDLPPPSPLEWLSSRSLVEDLPVDDVRADDRRADDRRADDAAPLTAERPSPFPRRRRTDDGPAPAYAEPDDLVTTERPAPPAPAGTGHPFGSPAAPPTAALPARPAPGHARLEQILADSGVQQTSGSRRRRRYRDEGDPEDDVLARVLRSNRP